MRRFLQLFGPTQFLRLLTSTTFFPPRSSKTTLQPLYSTVANPITTIFVLSDAYATRIYHPPAPINSLLDILLAFFSGIPSTIEDTGASTPSQARSFYPGTSFSMSPSFHTSLDLTLPLILHLLNQAQPLSTPISKTPQHQIPLPPWNLFSLKTCRLTQTHPHLPTPPHRTPPPPYHPPCIPCKPHRTPPPPYHPPCIPCKPDLDPVLLNP